jgi:hypothetical protein
MRLNQLTEKQVVHCPELWMAEKLANQFFKQDKIRLEKMIENWHIKESYTCYRLDMQTDLSVDFYSNNGFQIINFNDLDFEFVLPKKWCVKRNIDNFSILNRWANSFQAKSIFIGAEGYLHIAEYNGLLYVVFCSIDSGFTEITFEQFQEHVLGKEPSNVEKVFSGGIETEKEYMVQFDGGVFGGPYNNYDKALKLLQDYLTDNSSSKEGKIFALCTTVVKEFKFVELMIK